MRSARPPCSSRRSAVPAPSTHPTAERAGCAYAASGSGQRSQHLRNLLAQLGWTLGEDHTTFKQEGPQLVDDCSATRDQPIPHTMDRLQIELIIRLNRDESHVLSIDGLGDGFGIEESFLFDFTNGFTN
jgi:hypothetical protein